MAAILVAEPAAWVNGKLSQVFPVVTFISVVEDDAGEAYELCPAEGPCRSWSGSYVFNYTDYTGEVITMDTSWGPGPGWIIGVIAAVGAIIWVGLTALWSQNGRLPI